VELDLTALRTDRAFVQYLEDLWSPRVIVRVFVFVVGLDYSPTGPPLKFSSFFGEARTA